MTLFPEVHSSCDASPALRRGLSETLKYRQKVISDGQVSRHTKTVATGRLSLDGAGSSQLVSEFAS
ncbi:hypothetical protein V22_12250 [Calycomorphotria hydatis]|uniref:Uncharacterized protein n=1 Tax=Calycomorphotria hydatis TaxID=2528027 RepID=A0A517T6J0_9PLAN|nr:hypothetical protein V22_12250 [Calycomorphotria hydatis]